jgi:hypothetical protein
MRPIKVSNRVPAIIWPLLLLVLPVLALLSASLLRAGKSVLPATSVGSVQTLSSHASVAAAPLATGTATPVYDPLWYSVDGGGGTFSTGGVFGVGGTVGQPDAGVSSGGVFSVTGGFWSAAAPTPVLVGHVTWQGRPAQPNALQQLPITITLKAGTNEANYALQNTDASGFFTVSVVMLPGGAYSWRVKDPKYLANSGTVALSGALTTQQEMGLMRAGDANNDNVVSILDFNILKNAFGKAQGDPGYDDRADFTGDNAISILDFNLLKGNFGTAGAPPLGPLGR